MSELISKENLIKAIVNTPTNEQANTMQGYLDGIATRQLEIVDIINSLQTVSDKEIRDKVIDEFVKKMKSRIYDISKPYNPYLLGDVKRGFTFYNEALGDVWIILDEIAEQMKEVRE